MIKKSFRFGSHTSLFLCVVLMLVASRVNARCVTFIARCVRGSLLPGACSTSPQHNPRHCIPFALCCTWITDVCLFCVAAPN